VVKKLNTGLWLYVLLTLIVSGCRAGSSLPTSNVTASPSTAASMPTAGGPYWPTAGWRTALPQSQGMDPEKLRQMFAAIEGQNLNVRSLVIVRNGYIVAEYYQPPFDENSQHELYSCTKSFVSALVGIAIAEGYLEGVDKPVLECFPDYAFANTDTRKSAMTIEHLLSMTSGLDWPEGDPIYQQLWSSRDWVQFVLDRPMATEPGSQFNYNSGCSHVLSAIVADHSGMLTQQFAHERLFAPLGISNVNWSVDSNGLAIGGWGLNITARDMAKFGYLYLNEGVWDGQQIVPAEWVKASTTAHADTGQTFDYGYQWWTYPKWGAYAAKGRYGQLIFVIPEHKIVVVFTARMDDDRPLVALIEDYIVPAVQLAD